MIDGKAFLGLGMKKVKEHMSADASTLNPIFTGKAA